MTEQLVRVVFFCEWESLFDSSPPSDRVRSLFKDLSGRGLRFVFITRQTPDVIYKWCGKEHFPDAIISPTGLQGYKGRNLDLQILNKDDADILVDSVERYFRLVAMDGDLMIYMALLNEHAEVLAPLMDLVALDGRAEQPTVDNAQVALYRCEKQGDEAFEEWAALMTQRMKFITPRNNKSEQNSD
jgi:hypothetical protein